MSDTPRTDALLDELSVVKRTTFEHIVQMTRRFAEHAKQLERELVAANKRIEDVAELQELAQFWVNRCGILEGRIAELERKLRIEEQFRLDSMTKPAVGHDYWQRWYEAKLCVELAEAREKAVPGEPTDEMLESGAKMFEATLHSPADFKHHAYHVFKAMLAAAAEEGK